MLRVSAIPYDSGVVHSLILTGGGDFVDPWHPFAETSSRIAGILAELGHDVTISDSVTESLRHLDERAPDLLLINAGNAERPLATDAADVASVRDYLGGGGALIAVHVVSTAFPEVNEWERIVGGRWVRGTTMHPDQGDGEVRVVVGHPITQGIADFTIYDELYSWMRVAADDRVLATHHYEGVDHPIAWAREVDGARVVYDALGHDARSFDAEGHRQLLANSARWALREI